MSARGVRSAFLVLSLSRERGCWACYVRCVLCQDRFSAFGVPLLGHETSDRNPPDELALASPLVVATGCYKLGCVTQSRKLDRGRRDMRARERHFFILGELACKLALPVSVRAAFGTGGLHLRVWALTTSVVATPVGWASAAWLCSLRKPDEMLVVAPVLKHGPRSR